LALLVLLKKIQPNKEIQPNKVLDVIFDKIRMFVAVSLDCSGGLHVKKDETFNKNDFVGNFYNALFCNCIWMDLSKI
jgi:hypothetical protein